MARRLDQILVIDLESTCWEGPPPAGQSSEIIEVGICRVDVTTLERREKRSILVRPVRSQVSEFCTQLTSLTADDLKGAGTLSNATHILRKEYDSQARLWASWGDYDRRQFERVCKQDGIGYPFGLTHLNIKTLFSVAFGFDAEMGLDEAHALLGLPMDGRHHRGHDDAWNAAGLLCLVLQRMRRNSRQRTS
jgi:inhibitor of KinA sporulation pathway (predicted exonuclease)